MKQKVQLFLLHFAGGNCYSFQFLLPHLNDFEVIPLELPGRGKRIKEQLLTDFDEAAKDMYAQILSKLNSPLFLIYGHSLGAYLALRVTGMLEKINKAPVYLLVSGNAGPGVSDSKKMYLLGHEEFKKELKILGGVPEEFIQNEELFDFYEPILRSDFELAEKNQMDKETAVNMPIYAMMGSQEEDADKIANWGNFTTGEFNCETLEGDHFFIHKHPEHIAWLIKQCYNKVVLLSY